MRKFLVLASLGALSLMLGCGGNSSSNNSTSTPGGNTIATAAPNVAAMVVDGGPNAGTLSGVIVSNIAYTAVTICAHGFTDATHCQTIDHVQVDTGSSGLRILSTLANGTVTPSALGLTPVSVSSGTALGECIEFGDGYVWGSVQSADVYVAGESAQNLPIHIIGDPAAGQIPTTCSASGGTLENDVFSFGANGLLGVGNLVQDCGTACAPSSAGTPDVYYSCPTGGCTTSTPPTLVSLSLQVANPVATFTTDNNGVIVELPVIPASGVTKVNNGALVFGIGTQTNNTIGSASLFSTPIGDVIGTGTFTANFQGVAYANSYIDSGSSVIFFNDSLLPICPSNTVAAGLFCPSPTQGLTATNPTGNVAFSIANANTLFSGTNAAFNNVGGPVGDPTQFDWGLPFFYGRNVFFAIEGKATPYGTGPFVGY